MSSCPKTLRKRERFGYLSPDFSPGMQGRRIELFEVLSAIQRNPRLQVNFVSFRSV